MSSHSESDEKSPHARPQILMCRPHHYDVTYVINPWMGAGRGNVVTGLARRQWDALYEAIIEEAGAEVVLVEPAAGWPDMVFTANAGFVHRNKAIVSRFRYPERQGEEPYFKAFFEGHGFEIAVMPEGIAFEGAGDALVWQDRVFAGYRTRSDIASHNLITAETGLPVLSLELVDPRFYHVDVCICPLEDGHFIYYPGAFDHYGNTVIEANVPREKLIPVNPEEVGAFSCNAVNVGDTVILNRDAPQLIRDLRERGLRPVGLDMSEFIKSGGSCKCLTLRIG